MESQIPTKKRLSVSLRARDTFNSSMRSRESYRRERISWVCGEDGDHHRKGYLREAREPYTVYRVAGEAWIMGLGA